MNEEVNKTIAQTFDGFQIVMMIAVAVFLVFLLFRSLSRNKNK